MKDELITFETAKLAKEKGFNEKCKFRFFEGKGELEEQVTSDRKSFRVMEVSLTHFREMEIHYTLRPTQSLLSRWLREVHKIHISPMFIGPDTNKYQYRIDIENSGNTGEYSKWFTNFEECFEDGLMFGLKLIK